VSRYGWKPYVPVSARRAKAERAVTKARKGGAAHAPIAPFRGAIAKTFWGRAWCENLERYSDYANRLPRGRSYVRNGSVIDLRIEQGKVHAQVMGSRLYRVEVTVKDVASAHWQRLATACAGSIDSLVELLQGRLSSAVMERICHPGDGLFPAPRDIRFTCSCPDWADMCKHVAATLYGVGTRLDRQPELLFTLRGVDAAALITSVGTRLDASAPLPDAERRLETDALGDVFGIEMAGSEVAPPKRGRVAKTPARPVDAAGKRPARTVGSAGKTSTAGAKGAARVSRKARAKPADAKSRSARSTKGGSSASSATNASAARTSGSSAGTRARKPTQAVAKSVKQKVTVTPTPRKS
jgi:uncharacterized Zn finger protein